jgi:uncharacterized protein (TIGR00369 family)
MDENAGRRQGWGVEKVLEGEFAGWKRRERGDLYEGQVGPFYWRRDESGSLRGAFRAEKRHMNGAGFMHGGCLMTFADFLLFMIARYSLADRELWGVTATLNGEFVGSVSIGDRVEGTGEVVKAGGSLIFVRGTITVEAEPVMVFSGVIKRIKPRS